MVKWKQLAMSWEWHFCKLLISLRTGCFPGIETLKASKTDFLIFWKQRREFGWIGPLFENTSLRSWFGGKYWKTGAIVRLRVSRRRSRFGGKYWSMGAIRRHLVTRRRSWFGDRERRLCHTLWDTYNMARLAGTVPPWANALVGSCRWRNDRNILRRHWATICLNCCQECIGMIPKSCT